MIPEHKHIDREANPPTKVGACGAAWRVPVESVEGGTKDQQAATVAIWVVFAPGANIMWSYYVVCCVNLRGDVDGVPPKVAQDGATHEVIVLALDPRTTPNLKRPASTMLRPMNFVGQWRVGTRPNPVDLDRAAEAKIAGVIDEILAGTLSPDTDHIRAWVERFSDSNLRR